MARWSEEKTKREDKKEASGNLVATAYEKENTALAGMCPCQR